MRVDITVSQLISVDPGSDWIYVDDYPLCLWYAIISYYCFSSLVSLHQRHSSLFSVLLTESFGYLELKSFQIVPQAILSSSTWIIQHLLQCLNKQYPRLALFDLNLPQKINEAKRFALVPDVLNRFKFRFCRYLLSTSKEISLAAKRICV